MLALALATESATQRLSRSTPRLCGGIQTLSGGSQGVWDDVLALATDAEPPQPSARLASPTRADPGSATAASVRRHAVAVMDAVDRNGLVAPWTAVPHFVALTTDPNACVPAQACTFISSFMVGCWWV